MLIFSRYFCLYSTFLSVPGTFSLFPSSGKIWNVSLYVGRESAHTQGIFPITWPAVWWGRAPVLSSPGGSSQSPGAGGTRSSGSWGHSDSGQWWCVPRPLPPLDQWNRCISLHLMKLVNVYKAFKERATFKMHKWTSEHRRNVPSIIIEHKQTQQFLYFLVLLCLVDFL